jgi:hypothetical protein
MIEIQVLDGKRIVWKKEINGNPDQSFLVGLEQEISSFLEITGKWRGKPIAGNAGEEE